MMRSLPSPRWWLCVGVLAVLLAGGFAGCTGDNSAGTKRIIILTNGNSPYWDACAKGADDAAQELNFKAAGYQIQIERNNLTDKGQIDKLKNYASAVDIAAVGISVTDENNPAIADAMLALQQAGVKVITIDSDVNREKHAAARSAYVGTDNIIAGRELGKAARALVEKGDYMAFVGLKGASNAQGRIQGFEEGAGPDLQRAHYLEDKNPDKAAETVRGILTANLDSPPELLLGIWSYNTPALVKTVEELDLQDRVTVVGFDAEPNSIKALGEGRVDALLVQNPYQMGYIGVKLLKALVEDDQAALDELLPAGDIHTTDLKLIVPDEDDRLSQELFDETTRFMPLSEFQDWLNEHGLTGS